MHACMHVRIYLYIYTCFICFFGLSWLYTACLFQGVGGLYVLDISTATYMKIMKPFLVSLEAITKNAGKNNSAPQDWPQVDGFASSALIKGASVARNWQLGGLLLGEFHHDV